MPLLDLPEEILFVILESAILPLDPSLSLPEPQSLLTCRTIHRIGLPILYQSIILRSNPQALSVESTILSQPKLVCHIRHLYSSALVSWLPVFRAIGDAKGSLQTFDFVLHVSRGGGQTLLNGDPEDVWPTLSAVSGGQAWKLPSSNPACYYYLCLTTNRPPSRWRCPARLRCAFCALPYPRSGIRPYSSSARTPAWSSSCSQRRGYHAARRVWG
jgi:hypothetical protein